MCVCARAHVFFLADGNPVVENPDGVLDRLHFPMVCTFQLAHTAADACRLELKRSAAVSGAVGLAPGSARTDVAFGGRVQRSLL